jgi:hypothetical protein
MVLLHLLVYHWPWCHVNIASRSYQHAAAAVSITHDRNKRAKKAGITLTTNLTLVLAFLCDSMVNTALATGPTCKFPDVTSHLLKLWQTCFRICTMTKNWYQIWSPSNLLPRKESCPITSPVQGLKASKVVLCIPLYQVGLQFVLSCSSAFSSVLSTTWGHLVL